MDETVQEFYENAQQPHISSRAREEQRDELFSGELQCLTLSVQTEQSRAGDRPKSSETLQLETLAALINSGDKLVFSLIIFLIRKIQLKLF